MNTTKTDTENKPAVTTGKWGEAKRVELKRYKLLCIKQVKRKDMLRCTGKYSHYFVLTLNTLIYKNSESLCTSETNVIL